MSLIYAWTFFLAHVFSLIIKNQYKERDFINTIDICWKEIIRNSELLKQSQSIGERTIRIQDLKEMLGIEKKRYARYFNFKQRVILPACEEINEKTDINTDFKEIKTGKKS